MGSVKNFHHRKTSTPFPVTTRPPRPRPHPDSGYTLKREEPVNNAGIAPAASVETTTEKMFDQVIAINLKGEFLGMQAVVAGMRAAGSGSIVNVSSLAGMIGAANNLPYVASKWGVRGMTKAAALDLAPTIRVNSVHPGFIETPMIAEAKDALAPIVASIPLQRIADVQEVSDLVLYLASDESSYSTGSEFVVDGGLSAQ